MESVLDRHEARDDHRAIFADLMERNRDKSVHYVRRALGCDLDTAEDVAQDAFAIAFEKLGQFRSESSLDSWFFTILTRRIHYHRRWSNVRVKWRSFIGAAQETIDHTLERDPPLQKHLAQALAKLSPPQRDVFLLVHSQNFTVREAAGILDIQEGTAKSHLHRSLKKLRCLLETHHEA